MCLECKEEREDNGEPHDDSRNESRPIKHLPHLLARAQKEHGGKYTHDRAKGVGDPKPYIVSKEEEDGSKDGEGKSRYEADGKALNPRTPG